MRRTGTLLALLLAALMLLTVRNALQQEPAPEAEEAPVQQAAYRMLYERPLADFQGMTVTLPGGESYAVSSCMVHDAAGRLRGVTSMLGQPLTVDGRSDFALDSTAWQMMLVAAQNLPVTASYDALDQQACGLVSPSARVELRYTDGNAIRLTVGSRTASGYSCYVQMEGDPAVHLVPSDFYDVITRPLSAQHALPGALQQTTDNAGQVAVVGWVEGNIIATRNTQEDALLPWMVESPVRHSADSRQIERLIEGICAVHAESYWTTCYDAADLSACGLDQPVRLIASFYDGTIRDIHVGGDAGGGMVYVRMDSTGDIYLVSRDQLAFAEQATLEGLLDRFAALVPIRQLEYVDIALPERAVRMEQKWQSEDESIASGYAINGRQVDQKTFSAIYAQIIGLQFDRMPDSAAEAGECKAAVRFRMRDGTETALQMYAWNEHYDLIDAGGAGCYLIRCEKVDAMIDAIKGGLA